MTWTATEVRYNVFCDAKFLELRHISKGNTLPNNLIVQLNGAARTNTGKSGVLHQLFPSKQQGRKPNYFYAQPS